MAEPIPIAQVPKDIDPMEVGFVTNPLEETFKCAFDGNEIVIKPGEKFQSSLPVAVHVAKHLAERVIMLEHQAYIDAIEDERTRVMESQNAIPDFKERVFKKMKEITNAQTPVGKKSKFFGAGKEEIENAEKAVR